MIIIVSIVINVIVSMIMVLWLRLGSFNSATYDHTHAVDYIINHDD